MKKFGVAGIRTCDQSQADQYGNHHTMEADNLEKFVQNL